MSKEIEVKKFKKLVTEMFRGYPNYFYFGMVEADINKEKIDDLVKNGFLVKGEIIGRRKKTDAYSLGINALPIVSAWETEELTRKIKFLTIVIIVLTVITIIISVISLFKSC